MIQTETDQRARRITPEPCGGALDYGGPGLSLPSRLFPFTSRIINFRTAVESESRFALTGYPKKSTEDIRNDVWKKAADLGIPAKEEDIRVVVSDGSVDIDLDYSVPIDLQVYQFTLQFHPHADNHTI